MDKTAVKQVVIPLRMIFWGGLLCIFDFNLGVKTTTGAGFGLDILNDVVGASLIASGVFLLSEAPVHRRYSSAMRFLQVVSVLEVMDAVREQFVPPSESFHFIVHLFSLVLLAATVTFCIAMRWFCEEAHLFQAARSWFVTSVLFVLLYVLPVGVLDVIGLLAIAEWPRFQFGLGLAALLWTIAFVVPIVHLFVSVWRMKRAAQSL